MTYSEREREFTFPKNPTFYIGAKPGGFNNDRIAKARFYTFMQGGLSHDQMSVRLSFCQTREL